MSSRNQGWGDRGPGAPYYGHHTSHVPTAGGTNAAAGGEFGVSAYAQAAQEEARQQAPRYTYGAGPAPAASYGAPVYAAPPQEPPRAMPAPMPAPMPATQHYHARPAEVAYGHHAPSGAHHGRQVDPGVGVARGGGGGGGGGQQQQRPVLPSGNMPGDGAAAAGAGGGLAAPDMEGFPLIRLDHIPLLDNTLLWRAYDELNELLASVAQVRMIRWCCRAPLSGVVHGGLCAG